jgi:Reverse transcriptase (RNA-dependent DNA polymerase)
MHIIRAASQQQVACLYLLDLSAGFDRIDHSILLEHLSFWFGISGIALNWINWIKSYLTSRSFYVHLEDYRSSVFQFLYGVHQGPVLEPLLFILYSHSFGTVVSKSPVHHHVGLYADDVQLFISFSSVAFLANSSILEKDCCWTPLLDVRKSSHV